MSPANAQRLGELRTEIDAELTVIAESADGAVLCVVVPRDGAACFTLLIDESRRCDRRRH